MDELKIRGKRRRRTVQQDAEGSSRARGRPMKPTSDLAANKKRATSLQKALRPLPSSSTVHVASSKQASISHLENLPRELMQQVFFHCLEVNMMEASPNIREMLSNDLTHDLLILFAFFDDDGINPVETKHFKPARYRKLPVEEKTGLQQGILGCEWCTLSRIEACMPKLTRLKMVQEWHRVRYIMDSWPSDPSPNRVRDDPSGQVKSGPPPSKMPSLYDNEALESYYLVHPYLTMPDGSKKYDLAIYFPWLETFNLGLNEDGLSFNYRRNYIPIMCPTTLAVRHIPDRLLRGSPWTAEKLAFIRFLREGYCHILSDFDLRIQPGAIFRGMKDAVNENNPAALLVLLELHDTAFHIGEKTLSGVPVQNNNPHNQRYSTPYSHPIPLSLMHLATKCDYEGGEALVSLLLRSGLDSVPRDDPVMTKWALQAIANGCPRNSAAYLLLAYMEGPSSEVSVDMIHSRGGKADRSLNPSRYRFPGTESFALETGYRHLVPFSAEVESGRYV